MPGRRDPVFLLAATLVVVATVIGVLESTSWIGRPFPGFLLLENRVVASAGLGRWPGTHGGQIYQHEVVAADDRAFPSAASLRAYVASLPVGTPVRYRFESGQRGFERTIETRVFDGVDYLLLFGSYLFCGLGLAVMALAIRFLRGRDRVADGSALCLWIVGMYAITALDLYGPARLFRIHALFECFLAAGTLHMASVFPHPRRFVERSPGLLALPYAAAAGVALAMQVALFQPGYYGLVHRIAFTAFGASLVVLIASQLWAFLRPPSFRARQRVKVMMLGTLAALAPQALLSFASAASGGQAPENVAGWSGVLFPIAVGYAVLRSDLLQVDSILRRSVNYALLTAIVIVAYAGSLAGFEALFRDQTSWQRGTFMVLFAAVAVNLLLPLRDRLQSVIDRIFYRSTYDFRRVVAGSSARLASVAELGVIAGEIEHAVAGAFHPEWLALFIQRRSGRPLEPVVRRGAGAPTTPGPVETGPATGVVGEETLVVPFRAEGELVGLLRLGRRLSGRYYGAEDRALLLTLANQGAVAIENARALEELRVLNESLETKVRERTAELEKTLHELRQTQAQLVHQEKMASLGQFVAGIAHEMNNPMTFIEANVHFLKQSVDVLVDVLQRYRDMIEDPELRARFDALREERDLDTIIADFESIFEGCVEGVERTTSLVRDLRTFSRLESDRLVEVDLHHVLESNLNLLSGVLREVRLVKEFSELPPIESREGQLEQVFMNLLANASDAVDAGGTITIRTSRLGDDRVAVEVEDDGCGMEPDVLEHVFDPFFTTKEVGKGTGLGLAVTYGVVERHGGSIQARSEPGRGSRFRVELPIRQPS